MTRLLNHNTNCIGCRVDFSCSCIQHYCRYLLSPSMLQSQSIKIECALLIGICFIRMLPTEAIMHLSLPNPVTELRHHQLSFVPCDQLQTILLYRRWVQHNSDRCAEGLGRKVVSKLCSYYAGVAWKTC